MSNRSSGALTDEQSCSLGQAAGRPRTESLLRFDKENDPDLGTSLYEALVCQDTSRLADYGWLERLDAIALLENRVAALKAETIAGFDDSLRGVSADLGHRYPQPGDRAATAGERRWIAGDLRSVSDEIAGILELRRGHATTRIHRSCELVHNFPATLAALSAGHLTERAAFTIVAELSVLEDLADIRAAESAILEWIKTHPLVEIKQACQREVAHRSPEATEKAYQRAHDERSVRMYSDDLGRSDIVHNQSAIDGAAVMTSLSRAAIRCRRLGDPRSMDQLRADIALSRLLPGSKRPTPPTQPDTEAAAPPANAADEAAIRPPAAAGDEPSDEPLGEDPQATDVWYDDARNEPDRAGNTAHPHATAQRPEPPHSADPNGDTGKDHKNTRLGDQPGEGLVATDDPADRYGEDVPAGDRSRWTAPDVPDEAPAAAETSVGPETSVAAETSRGAETAGGAEAAVVIHATAAEVRALIEGAIGTGGETNQHGPLPQSTLRKHLLKALTQSLLPPLPSTSTSPRTPAPCTSAPRPSAGPGASATPSPPADPRASTTPSALPDPSTSSTPGAPAGPRASTTARPSADPRTSATAGLPAAPRTSATARPSAGSGAFSGRAGSAFAAVGSGLGSWVELQVTDRPPASNPDRYVPSAALDRYVRLRDRTCQFPGCNRPAEFTDLDHRTSFAAGGRTTAANLWCLCRHHHRLKHEGGWQIHLTPDGTYTWTSPTGRHHPNKRSHQPSNQSDRDPSQRRDRNGNGNQSSVQPTVTPS
ncbi:DUF222 domain-containing protein [Kribbella sp. NBC_00382]|uniref:HNH endonuclease signature motif containing protein n=1 Tax=Kribbella sp. NBC_00382 TaxID=2975967 RepID=UPI002E23832A